MRPGRRWSTGGKPSWYDGFVMAHRRWPCLLIALCVARPTPANGEEDLPRSALAAVAAAAADLPRLHSLLVSRRGELVLERYYNGARPDRPANVKSASKSVVSALVGIAIDRGLVAGVTQPLGAFFPDLPKSGDDARKREITIEDLLTMQSGLETTSNRNYGAWVQSRDWVRYVLRQPLVSPPGSRMEYSTGNTHLLSAILTRVSGTSTWHFAQETLADPLGFELARWTRDPQGVYLGGNNMLLTPRQMLAFGELYLHRGRAQDRQIVPEAWVDASVVPRTRSRWSDRLYGYGWWIRKLGGQQVFYAWGYGGQFIFVVPHLELVVVTTSSTTVEDERRGHRSTLYDVVERFIIEPITVRESRDGGSASSIHSGGTRDPS